MPKPIRATRDNFRVKGDPITKEVTVYINDRPVYVMEQRAFCDAHSGSHSACRECFGTDMQRSALGQ